MRLPRFPRRRTHQAGAPAPTPPPAVVPARPASGHLFVIGAARSGTTVFQNALNHSPDIFLMGEPNFHHDHGPGFAERYNARHRGWRNQETKSTLCPTVLEEDGSWRDYLDRLGRSHRWTGSKIVINPRIHEGWVDEMFAFHLRHFYDAAHVFTFRAPLAVVGSTRKLQEYVDGEQDRPRALLANYAHALLVFTRMVRVFPNVRTVLHEDIGERTFDDLGRWLGVPLGGCAGYYDAAREKPYSTEGFDAEELAMLAELEGLYAELRDEVRRGPTRPQIEQNDLNVVQSYFTPLGRMQRVARAVIARA